MRRRCFRMLSWGGALVLCVALSACTWLTDTDTSELDSEPDRIDASNESGPGFQTDADHYVALIKEDPRRYVEVEIPTTFVNPAEETVYLIGCIRPTMPTLQKLVGDDWVVAFAWAELACLSPPVPVRPGEAYRDTLQVHGYFPGQGIAPGFLTDVDGTYRLVRSIYADPEGEQLLSDSLRTSNTFELAVQSD